MPDKHSTDDDNQNNADDQFFNDMPSQPSRTMPTSDHNTEADEAATDAFNDLANAFAVGNTPSAADQEEEKEDTYVSRLQQSLPQFEATASQTQAHTTLDASNFDLSHLQQDHSTTEDTSLTAETLPPFDQTELDSNALLANQAPVYADLSGDDSQQKRPTGQIIAFVAALLLTISGGIYWYASDNEQSATSIQNNRIEPAPSKTQSTVPQAVAKNDITPAKVTVPPTNQANLNQASSNQTNTDQTNSSSDKAIASNTVTIIPPKKQSAPNHPTNVQTSPAKKHAMANNTTIKPSMSAKKINKTQTKAPQQTPAPQSIPQHLSVPTAAVQPTPAAQLIIVNPLTLQQAANPQPSKAQQTNKKIPVRQSLPNQVTITAAQTPAKTAKVDHSKAPQASKPMQLLIVQPLSLSQNTHSQAAEPASPPAQQQPTPTQLAVIEPSTAIQSANDAIKSAVIKSAVIKSAVIKNNVIQHHPAMQHVAAENWIVRAAVASNKTARQYLARFKAQHLDSKVIRVQGNGQIHHFIQIRGFSSQPAAQKQRDLMINTMGLKNVQVNQL